MSKEKFTFFWGEWPFSQWVPSKFTVDDVEYNCAEQYMMAAKARLFKDEESLKSIMKSTSPREQKALGRQIKGFIKNEWEKIAKDVVYKGSLAKYTQNRDMKEALLSTAGTTLVEASPYDKIWGIGLPAGHVDSFSRETWNGTNWLGEVLTDLRDHFLEERVKRLESNRKSV